MTKPTPDDALPHTRDVLEMAGALPQEAPAPGPANSLGSLLILLSLPCVLPVPGIGNVMGLALMGVAMLIWRSGNAGAIARPALARSFTLDATRQAQLKRSMERLEQWSGRWCRPRLQPLIQVPARSWQAAVASALVATMGMEIFLPIPLGNVLPAAALALLGLSWKHRDGLAALWSFALAAVALLYPFLLGLGAWQWVMAPLWHSLGLGDLKTADATQAAVI